MHKKLPRTYLIISVIICNCLFTGNTYAQLKAAFTANKTQGCSPMLVIFSDQSTGNPTGWKWDLGNGTISFQQNPSVTYFNPGTYNVKLTVTNASGTDELIKNAYITVNSNPTVNFSGTPVAGCFPMNVQFTDQSVAGSGTIANYLWDFGDGSAATIANPSHTYLNTGNFNVSLKITNSAGCISSLTKSQYIKVTTGVKAAFAIPDAIKCTAPATVDFVNQSSGTGTLSYQWFFGDGATSSTQNPSHVYASSGTYTVKLVVINSTGCTDTVTKINAVSIGNFKADFILPANACTNKNIDITNASLPDPVSVLWDFGDGTFSSQINPLKIYSAAGSYAIKLSADFGGCSDQISKTITISDKPVTAFTADKTGGCKPPFTVNFTNNSSGAVNYQWLFGDGSTSAAQSPAHTYLSSGSYDVTLIADNGAGCTDTLKKTQYIVIRAPLISLPDLPQADCAPFTYTFNPSITSVDPIATYFWDFGDGTTSNVANPSHTFITPGTYDIKLIVTTAGGCSDSVIALKGIGAGVKPAANFSAAPRDVCAFVPVVFTDLSTGNPDRWFWEFGDKGTSQIQNPSHIYQDTGYMTVTLIVWNNGCSDTLIFKDYVHILPPVARFKVESTCGAFSIKNFVDESIGADSWDWNFGDGTSSNIQNPSHTYSAPGTYDVTLTVKNNVTGCTHQSSIPVQVINEVADFAADATEICKGTAAVFRTVGVNQGSVISYIWDYGDGSAPDNSVIGQHVYVSAGRYTISLEITDVDGCKSSIKKDLYLKVNGPVADFVLPLHGCSDKPVEFTDKSSSDGEHDIKQWTWDFGDNIVQTFTSPPFEHTYLTAGNYLVKLKVTDSNGCADSISKAPLAISTVVAAFTSDSASCAKAAVSFTNQSAGEQLTYLWDFGDGITSTTTNPVHVFLNNGNYPVKLTATDKYGCSAVKQMDNPIAIVTPLADFTMSESFSSCPPLLVFFTDKSQNASSVLWDFGDGNFSTLRSPSHVYASAGIFDVEYTITSPGGCTSKAVNQVVINGPEGSFNYTNLSGCTPLNTNFIATIKNTSTLIWDFNDGITLPSPLQNVTHPYTIPGFYLPKMILIDAGGCVVAITGIDTIKVYGAEALFAVDKSLFCDSAVIQFRDSTLSNDAIQSYLWNFGDGTTSDLQNPVHTFSKAGNYNVSLSVSTVTGCSNKFTNDIPIKISPSPQISIAAPAGACIPAVFNFKGNIIFQDTSVITWKWDLGNGITSSLQNPPQQIYSAAGSYNINAIATNSSGCSDTSAITIEAFAIPNIVATNDTAVCRNTPLKLSATGGASYTWLPATNLSCSLCAEPVALPDSSVKYFVTGISDKGCMNKDSVSVVVVQPFDLNVSKGDTLCVGRSTQLNVSGTDFYTWSPGNGLSNTNIPNPTATPAVSTNYMVVGRDKQGCFTDTAFIFIKVNPLPAVDAGADKTIGIGSTVELTPVISSDVVKFQWTPPVGIVSANNATITVKPAQTTEYTLEVMTENGCRSKDNVTVFVLCNGANIFIPNTFSPNADGINDIFYPRGSGIFSVRSFRVYNRWGEVVFENSNFSANNESKGWNGTYKGKQLSADVYVYTIDIICENNQVLTLKGNVALIR